MHPVHQPRQQRVALRRAYLSSAKPLLAPLRLTVYLTVYDRLSV